MNVEYPQFRKLSNNKSYYRIESADHMTEIQVSGSRFSIHQLIARILPERVLISDILNQHGEHYISITEQEFNDFHQQCLQNLRQF